MAGVAGAQGLGVPPHYWYKFALEEGVDVSVARAEEVYSKVRRCTLLPRAAASARMRPSLLGFMCKGRRRPG